MHFKTWEKLSAALLAFLIAQPVGLVRAENFRHADQDEPNANSLQDDQDGSHDRDSDEHHDRDDVIRLLQKKVKYVFVIYQENRSFDSYFGTFPGAEGLFSHPAAQTPGFVQELINTDGSVTTISPFRIGPNDNCPDSTVNGTATTNCYAADTDDIDHSHPRTVAKMHVQGGAAQMDQFAVTEELKYSPTGNPSIKAKQFGELAMAYEDCDTVPLLWRYADRFVLFDHIFETMTGPSTPGNLAIIGAQSGQTQWALHPNEAFTGNGASGPGVPVVNDSNPVWGKSIEPSDNPPLTPVNPTDTTTAATAQYNLTFATLPLTLAGENLKHLTKADRDATDDLADVQEDVEFIDHLHSEAVPFGWYQEGYDKEVTDPNEGPVDANGTHASYITHHNGPQYFGYIANNPKMVKQLHGLGDFFDAIENRTFPKEGGVFYVKGGFTNLFGLTPSDQDKKVQSNFLGDDDHPGYSDAQISEAMVAEAINKIADSPYWSQSAIIITWDDSEGDYDHVPPPLRTTGPDSTSDWVANGPRVPFLVISPYARTHYIAHAQGSQSSVVKFVDRLFNLTPLALLPDELAGRKLGQQEFHQDDIGPEDALTPGITDLLDAFSPERLRGEEDPLSPDYVKIPEKLVTNLPQTAGYGCKDLGIVPTDKSLGITNHIPSDFNPRPSTNPTP
jgi:phospholipase C